MIHWRRQIVEEFLEQMKICGIEGGSAECLDLGADFISGISRDLVEH